MTSVCSTSHYQLIPSDHTISKNVVCPVKEIILKVALASLATLAIGVASIYLLPPLVGLGLTLLATSLPIAVAIHIISKRNKAIHQEFAVFEEGLTEWLASPMAQGRKVDAATSLRKAYKNKYKVSTHFHHWFFRDHVNKQGLMSKHYNQDLDLSQKQLNSLPEVIGMLTHLRKLDLGGNELVEIPASIENLINLNILIINNNYFSNLPAEIGGLTQLTHFNLAGNRVDTLPKEIGKLINLQWLDAIRNRLTVLPEEIECLTDLRVLLVSDNLLASLPENIGDLPNLESLDVSNNHLERLPKSLEQFRDHGTLLKWGQVSYSDLCL